MSDDQPNNENTVPSSHMGAAQLQEEHYAQLQKRQKLRRYLILFTVLICAVLSAALYFFWVA